MGVDTKARLKGRVRHEEVLNFIKQKIDRNAVSGVKKDIHKTKITCEHAKYGNEDDWFSEHGFIYFTSKEGNERSLFYNYENINSFENLKYYEEYGLGDMVKSETTYLSLGFNDEAVEIMRDIVTEFGGWIDENDCDDKEFEPIVKNEDGSIKPVLRVTMQDIYDKFGGIVIIEK